jgi:hypothetical protein
VEKQAVDASNENLRISKLAFNDLSDGMERKGLTHIDRPQHDQERGSVLRLDLGKDAHDGTRGRSVLSLDALLCLCTVYENHQSSDGAVIRSWTCVAPKFGLDKIHSSI